jgi:hypothetical protein
MRHQRGQHEGQEEHQATEPGSAFLQHIGRLSASQGIHHTGTKGSSKALLTRALHQNDEDEEQTDDRRQHHEETDKNGHKGSQYGTVRLLGKGNRFPGRPLCRLVSLARPCTTAARQVFSR